MNSDCVKKKSPALSAPGEAFAAERKTLDLAGATPA